MVHIPHHSGPRIPSLLAFFVLAFFGFGLSVLFQRPDQLKTQDVSVLERVDVVNVRDTSVTLFWRTKKPTLGLVKYTFNNSEVRAYDDRDLDGKPKPRMNHIVTLHGLSPDSMISYRIGVDDELLGQTAEIPFQIATSRKLTHAQDAEPLVGTVIRQDGGGVSDAFVIAYIPQAKPLLTQSLSDGSFLISLCCVIDQTRSEPRSVDVDLPIRYEVITEQGVVAHIQTKISDVMALNIDAPENKPGFVQMEDRALAQNSSNVQPQVTSQPQVLAVTESSFEFQDIDIVYPREGGFIPAARPLIKGFAEPGMEVKGTFKPENRLFQVTASDKRVWEYEPSFDFEPGQHELTIDTIDSTGKKYSLKRTFTIMKSGESVLGDATDSATLTPSPTVTPELTATPSPTTITPTSTPPVTGLNIVPLTLVSFVLIVIGAGIVLLL